MHPRKIERSLYRTRPRWLRIHRRQRQERGAFVARVLVGTAGAVPVARVIDVAEEELVKEFKLDSVSNIRPGRHAHEWLLVSREPGAVRTLHTGMREEDHGDHKHWMAKAPELSEPLVWGKRPSHANAGGNRVAAFLMAMA
ncbi:MAG: hypothetical protein HC858_12955 [Brachymonas sp.]|nr:hypothetical protein [Brachymonas sp.]